MFAAMYSYSNDLFVAPENPGIELFDDAGVPRTGVVANALKLWDNGTRVNEAPGPGVVHPGVAQEGVVTEVNGTDSEGHTYPAASALMQVSPRIRRREVAVHPYDYQYVGQHLQRDSLSGGVYVVSNVIDGDLVAKTPFFNRDQKSGVELTALAENGDTAPLYQLVAGQTGIITTLQSAIVVVCTPATRTPSTSSARRMRSSVYVGPRTARR